MGYKRSYPPNGMGHIGYLLAFIGYCHSTLQLSYGTVKLYFAGVQHHWHIRFPDRASLFSAHPDKAILKGVKKRSVVKRPSRIPFTGSLFRSINSLLRENPFGHYTSTLIKTAMYLRFYGFLRPSELSGFNTPAKSLLKSQLQRHGDIYVYPCHLLKTSRPGESAVVRYFKQITNGAT